MSKKDSPQFGLRLCFIRIAQMNFTGIKTKPIDFSPKFIGFVNTHMISDKPSIRMPEGIAA
jgi:hypothetical protein